MLRIWQLSARKLTGDASIEELQELEQLLKDYPDLTIELELHNNYFNTKADSREDTHQAWQRQLKKMEEVFPEDFDEHYFVELPGHTHRRLWIAISALAASVFLFFLFQNKWISKTSSSTQIATLGKKHEVLLPDGTKVILNKNTRLYLGEGFGKNNRNVTLDGEAFFDVVHNKNIPFVVSAATVSIKVVGTAFNVRAYADEEKVQASLVRGIIEVTDTKHPEMKMILNPNEKITIGLSPQPGPNVAGAEKEKAYSYRMDILGKEPVSGVLPEVAWTEEKLAFESETFEEVASKLEKWYNVSIEIKGDKLATEKFTGVFENQSIEDALKALQITYPFKYKIVDSKIIINE